VLKFEAGNHLRAAADRIAALTLARDYAERPALLERYGEAGRAKYRQDVLYNVAALAGALDAGDCAIFLRYVAWLKIVLVSRGVALKDVEASLRCMSIALGEDLGANHSIAASFLSQALEHLDSMPASVPSFLETSSAETAVAQRVLDALLRLDSSAAREALQQAVAEGMTLVRIYSEVLPPLMREIGRLWQMNTISVALEHYCSAAVQSILAGFYGAMFAAAPPAQRSLLVTCVEGEQHELGARTVADVFQLNGWKTVFLGANLPPRDLAAMIQQAHDAPDLIALCATMPDRVAQTEAAIEAIRDCAKIPILVGGYLFHGSPRLAEQLGADGYAPDAESALKIADRLAPRAR
jgi:MerR family transcriptional regulator, light-induced transcriptional regulator